MKQIKLSTTAPQTVTCAQLERIAHDYLGIQQTLDDESYGCRSLGADKLQLPDVISASDGVYPDTKDAFRKRGVFIASDIEYVRILDDAVKDILLTNVSHSVEGRITKSEAAAYNITSTIFKANDNIRNLDCLEYFGNGTYRGVENIFANDPNLESIRLPKGLTCVCILNSYDFWGDYKLKSIYMHDLTVLGKEAFKDITGIKKIIIDSIKKYLDIQGPGNGVSHSSTAYPSHGGNASLYLRSDEDNPLGTESNPLVIPSSIKAFPDYVFYNLKTLNFIVYEGTVSEYLAITKGTSWHYNVPCTQVYCIADGEYCDIDAVADTSSDTTTE